MITVRVYDDYNSIALQAVDTDDHEVSEFLTLSRRTGHNLKKFRAKSIGDMKKLVGCVGHYNHPNYLKIQLLCVCKGL